ncbi:M28 family peptidase [Pseudomonas sp. NPDC007930]|uniref:M28 family peptidase n=1 Tax=Pseudomonas sp. NPDC007930 TaxID=3364417 RepID=UPI0036E3499D
MTLLEQQRQQAIADTLHGVRKIIGNQGVNPEALVAVSALLEGLARHRELFGADAFAPAPPGGASDYARYPLHEDADQQFALYLNVLNPGKNSAPHNHTTWVVVAAVEGEEVNRRYRWVGPREPIEAASLAYVDSVSVRPGTGVAFMPDDFHSIHIQGSAPARQLHLYGRALETLDARLGFDEVSGRMVRHNNHRYSHISGFHTPKPVSDTTMSISHLPTTPVAAGIDGTALLDTVERIAKLGNKIAGSAAEADAAQFIADQVKALGVEHSIERFESFIHWPEVASIAVPGGPSIAAAGVAFARSTGPEGLTAALGELAGSADLHGRIALVEGLPHYDVCVAAAQRGAVAVLGISSGEQRHNWQISPLWGPPTHLTELERLSPVPAAVLNRPDGEYLRTLIPSDVAVRLTAITHADWRGVQMPTATIPGQEPLFVLIGGHYCSWGPGASDNATGNALMLDLIRHFAAGPTPRYGLKFVWWTGHEQGGYAGSSWYADEHWSELRRNAIAYLNVDNVGTRDSVVKIIQNTTAELSHFTQQVLAHSLDGASDHSDRFKGGLKRKDKYVAQSRCGRNGDQSFSGIGLPTLQVASYLPAGHAEEIPGSGLGWWWHTQDDTRAHCSAEVLAIDTLIYQNLVNGLVNAPVLPFDLHETAGDFIDSLREYREAAPGWPPLEALWHSAHAFRELAARYPGGDDRFTLQVLKPLNAVLHHGQSDFEYDVTRKSRLLPGLEPLLGLANLAHDAQLMARFGLRRKVNRIAEALATATRELERYLSAQGD